MSRCSRAPPERMKTDLEKYNSPNRDSFLLLTKVVVTHLAKSKCKLAVYTKIDWTRPPPFTKGMLPIHASAIQNDANNDQLSLLKQH